ncbi:hypothetical protein M427DRAFT_102386 [Gonapodya prolifera JEL478]|uniref:RING-type domain-containing protein n=1 Tax=Gonapodya prolifera (strain JEL478) TaxID=1344416 RepID=A0A139A3N4_GONPJ|nr:hypothetical protein M427DRAFT_102386 [Gonapodya prolifera JEL478]|eukprot:KXS11426.1 hypothetical protein M427DRAFT_102386 [Gonapodya prolifera JEL478]
MQPLRKPAKAPAPVKKQLQQETQKADEYALFGPVPIEGCPQCNQKIGMNPNMRMFVGPCYHRMCGACVDKFFKHRSRCPVSGCSFQLRRVDMKPQRFEDLSVQRDAEVRKEFSEIFNKRQEDFKDLCEYNDYLQWTEDMSKSHL